MKSPMRYVFAVLAVLVGVPVGVAGIVYGEADDSPGLQLLGVGLALGAIVLGVRFARRGR